MKIKVTTFKIYWMKCQSDRKKIPWSSEEHLFNYYDKPLVYYIVHTLFPVSESCPRWQIIFKAGGHSILPLLMFVWRTVFEYLYCQYLCWKLQILITCSKKTINVLINYSSSICKYLYEYKINLSTDLTHIQHKSKLWLCMSGQYDLNKHFLPKLEKPVIF